MLEGEIGMIRTSTFPVERLQLQAQNISITDFGVSFTSGVQTFGCHLNFLGQVDSMIEVCT